MVQIDYLTEVVSLDGMLNEILVDPDYKNAEDWKSFHIEGELITEFFTTIDYVFKRLRAVDSYNLLTVAIEPEYDCKDININGFEFIGYELLDPDFSISALTNCGGFHESFSPTDINHKGLIDNFQLALDIKKRLLKNNPEEHHADTNVIGVWRHKTLGQSNK